VYQGSLYVGVTPFTLQLPRNQFSYISVETQEGRTGSAAYRDNDIVRGRVRFDRINDTTGMAAFNTKVPISPEEKRVDKARRGFYGAYGAFWVVLPVALLAAGVAGAYIEANNYVASYTIYDDYDKRKKIYDDAITANRIRIAATITWSTALAATFFQIGRYLYVSGGDSTPIVKAPPKKTNDENVTEPSVEITNDENGIVPSVEIMSDENMTEASLVTTENGTEL
jgi:hypothetical protein